MHAHIDFTLHSCFCCSMKELMNPYASLKKGCFEFIRDKNVSVKNINEILFIIFYVLLIIFLNKHQS